MNLSPVNYCQVCGTKMEDRQAFGKVRRVCPACGFVHFRDPKVAAVTFIEKDGHVLLIRRAVDPERGKWALPAGYIDYGEDPRRAAAREVYEETGLTVTITRLIEVEGGPGTYGASIVIIFAARVVNGVAQPRDDAEAVRWYAPSDPLPDLAFESTHMMLDRWIKHRQEQ
jgi:8-oxo-dGTP diphosphatase